MEQTVSEFQIAIREFRQKSYEYSEKTSRHVVEVRMDDFDGHRPFGTIYTVVRD